MHYRSQKIKLYNKNNIKNAKSDHKNIYLVEGKGVGAFDVEFLHMTKDQAAQLRVEHPEWTIRFWMKALTHHREAQFGNWLTRIRNFLMIPVNMIRTISERVVEIATPMIEQEIENISLESEQIAEDFIDTFGMKNLNEADEVTMRMVQNKEMTAKTAQTVEIGYQQGVEMSGMEGMEGLEGIEDAGSTVQESLADNDKFQDALDSDSEIVAEVIANAITRAGVQALSEQGINLPPGVSEFARNQVLSTLRSSFGRFLRDLFHNAISSVLEKRLGSAFEFVVQGSELAPKTNAMTNMLSGIFSPQVPPPQSGNGIVSKFIGGSIPIVGAFMGIAIGSMIKSLGGLEASSDDVVRHGNNWYNLYIESADKDLYVAYLLQPGQHPEIIEGSYVQAYSTQQARKLVLDRQNEVSRRIKRYESYDEYGIVVHWTKAPQKQDKSENPANNIENEIGEALAKPHEPQQMNFFTLLCQKAPRSLV